MIDCFLGDAFRAFSCPFWCTVLQCYARLQTHLKILDRVVSGARFLNWECVSLTGSGTLQILGLWQYYVCWVRQIVTRCTSFSVLYLCRKYQCGLHAMLLSLCFWMPGTIFLTLCSMVWAWRVLRKGQFLFMGLCCSLPFCLLLFSLSILSLCKLILWCWFRWGFTVLPLYPNLFPSGHYLI